MDNLNAQKIYYHDIGIVHYSEALAIQKYFHSLCVQAEIGGLILKVEHPPVITLGKNADQSNLLVSLVELEKEGVEVCQTDRGGNITAHMPGQLVVYPILPLVLFRNSVRDFVCFLEKSVIELLQDAGIKAHTDSDNPGVWVGPKKIAAIGVRIKNRVSMHGIALNISNSLDLFEAIIPCGIRNKGVTSMSQEVGSSASAPSYWPKLLTIMTKNLRQGIHFDQLPQNTCFPKSSRIISPPTTNI